MTGTRAPAVSSRRSTSNPSMPGSRTSSSTSLGAARSIVASASSPLPASTTEIDSSSR